MCLKHKPGDLCVFTTDDPVWRYKQGALCMVVRVEERYMEGVLYRIQFQDDHTYGDAYQDELTPASRDARDIYPTVAGRTFTSDELAGRHLDDGNCPVCGCTDIREKGITLNPRGKIVVWCHCDSCGSEYDLTYELKSARVLDENGD